MAPSAPRRCRNGGRMGQGGCAGGDRTCARALFCRCFLFCFFFTLITLARCYVVCEILSALGWAGLGWQSVEGGGTRRTRERYGRTYREGRLYMCQEAAFSFNSGNVFESNLTFLESVHPYVVVSLSFPLTRRLALSLSHFLTHHHTLPALPCQDPARPKCHLKSHDKAEKKKETV